MTIRTQRAFAVAAPLIGALLSYSAASRADNPIVHDQLHR